MSNPLELMTKTQIMREYGLPTATIDKAIQNGELRSLKTNRYGGRHYIPRVQVENLIRKRCGMPEVEL